MNLATQISLLRAIRKDGVETTLIHHPKQDEQDYIKMFEGISEEVIGNTIKSLQLEMKKTYSERSLIQNLWEL